MKRIALLGLVLGLLGACATQPPQPAQQSTSRPAEKAPLPNGSTGAY